MRLMNKILKGAETYANAYIDDIIVYSTTFDDHIKHLTDVFQRIREAGMTARPKKCSVGYTETSYLGYSIGCGMLKPEELKVKAIQDFPRPVTKSEVRSMLGLFVYYQKFIANYADITAPLTDLTKKNAPTTVSWTTKCEQSFKAVKEMLSSSPVLSIPDFSKPFLVQTDASDIGLGVILSQVGTGGEEHPICYLSRKLLPRERNYSVIEKECLAIVWGLNLLAPYLMGQPFIVQTDHNPIRWLHSFRNKNQRLMRWSLLLQDFDFKIVHKKGSLHLNVDALSRSGV